MIGRNNNDGVLQHQQGKNHRSARLTPDPDDLAHLELHTADEAVLTGLLDVQTQVGTVVRRLRRISTRRTVVHHAVVKDLIGALVSLQ